MGRIYRVGIELEGGWAAPPTLPLHQDASVHNPIYIYLKPDLSDAKPLIQAPFVGELISHPMRKMEVGKWLESNYPGGWFSSCTCERGCSVGLHVHVSLKADADYARLMNPKFKDFFLKRAWELVATLTLGSRYRSFFENRLFGDNRFCMAKLDTQRQLGLLDKPQSGERRDVRRTILNYAYGMHKTLECRVFPMAPSWMEAKTVVFLFINAVEDFLKDAPPIKKRQFLVRLKHKDLKRVEEKVKKKKSLGGGMPPPLWREPPTRRPPLPPPIDRERLEELRQIVAQRARTAPLDVRSQLDRLPTDESANAPAVTTVVGGGIRSPFTYSYVDWNGNGVTNTLSGQAQAAQAIPPAIYRPPSEEEIEAARAAITGTTTRRRR